MDTRDWFIMGVVAAAWAAGTVFLFEFASKTNAVGLLAAWGGICSTMTCAYHWLVVRDSKQKDADDGRPS